MSTHASAAESSTSSTEPRSATSLSGSCSGGTSGITATKRAPPPPSAQMRPPCPSTMVLQIDSPSPVPERFLVREVRACSKRSKMRSRSPSAMPSPEFQTESATKPGASMDWPTVTRTSPLPGVYLSALVSRLFTTCSMRTGSASTFTSGGASTSTSIFRSAKAGP